MNELIQKQNDIHKTIVEQNNLYFNLWKEYVFTWRWWLAAAMLIIPWIIWFLLRDKKSTGRFLLSGFFIYFITSFLDSSGVPFGLWHYNFTPLPYIHSFFIPWDFSLFPVTVMLMLQYKPKVSPYIKALIFSLFTAFIAEPLFAWTHIYEPDRWKYYYGVPIYFIIYLLGNRISKIKSFS